MDRVRRIVLQHASGLAQILGTEAQLKEGLKSEGLPLRVDNVDFLDHTGSCVLDTVQPRYVLYKGIAA